MKNIKYRVGFCAIFVFSLFSFFFVGTVSFIKDAQKTILLNKKTINIKIVMMRVIVLVN